MGIEVDGLHLVHAGGSHGSLYLVAEVELVAEDVSAFF